MRIFGLTAILLAVATMTATAATLTGRVATTSGAPLAGVAVSDGITVTVTDSDGRYVLDSNKRLGYVFYSLPSGYEPTAETSSPLIGQAKAASPDRGDKNLGGGEAKRNPRDNTAIPILLAPLGATGHQRVGDVGPGLGLAAMEQTFNPRFWVTLDNPDPSIDESHDFTLVPAADDGTRHAMLVAADTHLARRIGDLNRFQYTFMPRLKREVRRLREQEGYATIHSTILGDLTWDRFWRANGFDLHDFMDFMEQCRWPVTLWPVIGNHDNDPSVPAGADTDHLAAAPWRDIVCPSYYSFNIGRVHYVVLDDIYYLNEALPGVTYSDDVAGSRNNEARLTQEQLDWLDADLALVESDRPVVVCLHIPVWELNNNRNTVPRLTGDGADDLCNCLDRFNQVLILSGHIHTNSTMHPTAHPNVTERNVAAVCSSWWWTAHYTGRDVCLDGSPGGFELLEVDGDRLNWRYLSTEADTGDAQMRVYDMNTVARFYRDNATMRAIIERYPSRQDYANIEPNTVMVNVFNYDSRTWRVNIYEGDTRLWWTHEAMEDPLHTLCYDVPCYADMGNYTEYFATPRNLHTFTARATTATQPITVIVTDGQGRTFIKCVDRPTPYATTMDALQRPLAPGDVNRDGKVDVGDVNAVLARILGDPAAALLPLADVNRDATVDVGDVNTILDAILSM